MKATDEQIVQLRSIPDTCKCTDCRNQREALAAVLEELTTLRKEVARIDRVDDLNRELIAAQTEQDNKHIAIRGENAKLKRLAEAVRQFGTEAHYSMGEASGLWDRLVAPHLK